MKYTIHSESEGNTRLALVRDEKGRPCVSVVDDNGDPISGGELVSFTKKGTIKRHKPSRSLGFKTNSRGQVLTLKN